MKMNVMEIMTISPTTMEAIAPSRVAFFKYKPPMTAGTRTATPPLESTNKSASAVGRVSAKTPEAIQIIRNPIFAKL